MVPVVSCEQDNLAALIESLRGREVDAHYLAYFECFNRQQYFEAHQVLEPLWLSQRGAPRERFYKGLIQ
jgi:predicted metal-dependent hydrolase